jgi:hypothetical protein
VGKLIAALVGWFAVSPFAAVALARGMRHRRQPIPSPAPAAAAAISAPALPAAATVATAHGLTSSCELVIGAAETLRADWELLAATQRDAVLATVIEQSRLVRDVLVALTDGVADHVRQALDDLDRPLNLPAAVDGAATRP